MRVSLKTKEAMRLESLVRSLTYTCENILRKAKMKNKNFSVKGMPYFENVEKLHKESERAWLSSFVAFLNWIYDR